MCTTHMLLYVLFPFIMFRGKDVLLYSTAFMLLVCFCLQVTKFLKL